LFVPDLSSVLAVGTLIYSLFVFGGPEKFFRDSDAGWHIRNGESILTNHTLPRTDPYSFSKPGEPWIAWEWGSDVLLGLANRLDGLRGVTMIIAVAIAVCTWMCCRLQFLTGGDFLLAALIAPPMITTASMHWLARPHVFGWVFLVGAVLYAEWRAGRPEGQAGGLPYMELGTVAAVSALWANMHGSFFLGPVIALIYAASHFFRSLLWPADTQTEQERGRWFLWVALAALGGSLANPYGWRLHQHVFSYLRNEELTSHVAEFQSFNFHSAGSAQVLIALGIAVVGGILALGQRRIAHFFLMAGLMWAGLRSARILPLVALLLLPLANGAVAEALRRAWSLRPRVKAALDAALDYSGRLRAIDARMNGAVVCAIAALLAFAAMPAPGFSVQQFPVAAMTAVQQLPAKARILAPDSYGGYLIYLFSGERKVYIDGRSDFYGAEFMKRYLTLIEARPGWREIVRSFGFTHALLPSDSPLIGALEQAGWTRLYEDKVAVLLWGP
jgi:hypothetical protein